MNAPEVDTEAKSPFVRDVTRRDTLKMGAWGAGAVAMGLGLAACGGSSSSGSGSTTAGAAQKLSPGPAKGTPVKGGTLTVGIITSGKAETISVPVSLNTPDIARVLNLYDLMFEQLPGGKAGPGLIESASSNADATVWNFKVRQGVVWHDGKPLTADDIVYTIQHSWGASTNIFNAVLKQIVDFANVKKVGPHEVRIPLKHGVAQFPTITCFNSCAVVQDGTKDFTKGIGTGPFKLVSFEAGSKSVFSANTNYWGDGPYVDQLIIDSSFSTEDSRMNALLAGQLDIAPGVSPTLARANAASGRVVLGNIAGPGFVNLNMRVDKGPLKDPAIRQALKLIPDRQAFVNTVWNGYATVGNDLGGNTDQFYASDIKPEHDIAKAKSLLKKAGASDLQITLDTAGAYPGMNETASLFSEQAKAAGVDVKVNKTDPATFFTPASNFFERSFSTSFYTTGVNSLATFYLATSIQGGPYDEGHFGSPADDKLIFSALKETDESKAATLWHDVQVRQHEAGAYLIPANITWLDAYSLNTRGIQTTSALNCDNYNFKTAWVKK